MSRKHSLDFDPSSIYGKQLANKNLIMACLKNYRKQLSLTTFRRVCSNTKEVF